MQPAETSSAGEEEFAGSPGRHLPPTHRARLDPWPLDWRAAGEFIITYIGLVILGLALGWILLGALDGSALSDFDVDTSAWLESIRVPEWDRLTKIGSNFAGTIYVIGALVLLMVLFTWWWRRWRESLTLGTALALEASVFLTVSLTVGRERPAVEQLDVSPPTASFPSGHTGAAFAFYIALAIIVFWNTENPLVRTIAVIGAIVLSVSVALSRLYRGMHFVTDVVVGAGLGVLCVLLAAGIVQRAIARTREE